MRSCWRASGAPAFISSRIAVGAVYQTVTLWRAIVSYQRRALKPGGRFLFTAHLEPLEWLDAMTNRRSQSLGAQAYERLLRDAGLVWVDEAQDEGENHYYFAERRSAARPAAEPQRWQRRREVRCATV